MFFAQSPKCPHLALVLASSICATGFAGQPDEKPPAKPDPAAPAFRADPKPPPATEPGPPALPPAKPPVEKPAGETPPAPNPAPADPSALPQAAPPEATAPPGSPPPEPSLMTGTQNVTINLLNLMVKKGLVTREEADQLIRDAQAEAAEARNQAQADAEGAAQKVFRLEAQNLLPDSGLAPSDAIRVTYIPEMVKKQIRDEVRQDVMARAKAENWVEGHKSPEWVTRFRVKGDVRLRYEGNWFPDGNDNTGAFPNFNSINTGAPFDVAGTVFSPQLNVDQDRTRFRLRARIGAEVDMGDNFTAGVRIATGETNTPTSHNQSLGLAAQGQGGNFSKYAIWLDRAFIKYEAGADPDRRLTVVAGRGDNPFYSTDLIYDEDLGFDGIAVQGRYRVSENFVPFAAAGAFPVFNTDFNFSSNQPSKFDSTDRYLYGAQLGADINLRKTLALKVAAAYYHFDGVEGQQSTPYTPLNASDAGDTDNTRPSFAQKGNTYMPLRRIIPNANNNFGTTNQFQYFGLATKFQPVAVTAKLDYNGFEPVQVSIFGEYIKNLGFDRDRLNALGVNNRAPNSAGGSPGAYAGGDVAWMAGIRAGAATFQKRGDWQLGVLYKHIESDAVIDGFNDSDFGLGGTNMKGYAVWGGVALSPRTSLSVRWITTKEIAGPPNSNDTLLFDFGGRF